MADKSQNASGKTKDSPPIVELTELTHIPDRKKLLEIPAVSFRKLRRE
jgi:hypothetical protein